MTTMKVDLVAALERMTRLAEKLSTSAKDRSVAAALVSDALLLRSHARLCQEYREAMKASDYDRAHDYDDGCSAGHVVMAERALLAFVRGETPTTQQEEGTDNG